MQALWLLLPVVSLAQKSFSVRHYTSQNGLPQNSIKSMMMDHYGLLWLATESGIVRFDGHHFKTFNVANCPDMVDNRLSGMFKMPDNTIAVNDECGSLLLINNNRITRARKGNKDRSYYMPIRGGLPNTALYEHMFLQLFPDSSSPSPQFPWQTDPFFVYPVSPGTYWIRGIGRMLLYNNNTLSRQIAVPEADLEKVFVVGNQLFFPNARNEVYCIGDDSEQLDKWTFTGDLLRDPDRHTPLTKMNLFSKYGLNGAYIKKGVNLYIIRKNERTRELVTELLTNQLPQNCLISDVFLHPYYNTLYIGTDTKGLFILKEETIRTLTYTSLNEGDNNAYYAQLAVDSSHVITTDNRLFGLDGVTQTNMLPGKATKEFLMRDQKGYYWYFNYDTAFRYDPVKKKKEFLVGNNGEHLNIMYEEGDSIWVGSSRGIFYIKDWKIHGLISFSALGVNLTPKCLYRHTDGQLYFMNCTGAFRVNTLTLRIDTINELRDKCIRSIEKHGELVYIGTYGQGFYVLSGDRVFKMPLDVHRYLSEVHSFLFDKRNYVWMSTNNGLFRASVNDITHYVADTTSVLYYAYFNRTDGIRNTEFNGGCSPSGIRLANGYFSFPSMEGLVWFDPLAVNDPPPSGPILIDEILEDNMMLRITDAVTLTPGFEKIDIRLAVPYWGNEENIRIEYRLEGFNAGWITMMAGEKGISFSKLPSGTYTLHIRKKAGYGSGNFVNTSIVIHVPERFYETTAFIIGCGIAAVLLFWVGVRLYVSNIRQRTFLLEQKVNERTVELISMNDHLMANYKKLRESTQQLRQSNELKDQLVSIISHDILTPLKFISVVARNFVSGKRDNEGAKEIIRDIHHTSERLYQNSQNILNWVKYQNTAITVSHESVAPYSVAEDIRELLQDLALLRKNTIVNEVEMDDIVKTDRTIFTIIVQNIISNAVKYTHSSMITISSRQTENGYALQVSDDGPGIGATNLKRIEAIRNKSRTDIFNHAAEGTGLGYVIIFDLASLINAKVDVESTPDVGTTITITLL
jgi:signal transduction histidine kinase